MIEQPLAEYTERRFWKRRKFILYPGHLRIDGRHGGSTFSHRLPLDNIQLPSASVQIRDSATQALAATPFIIAVITTALWGTRVYSISPALFYMLLALMVIGMLGAGFFVKRTPYSQYYTTAGVAVFNIGQLGKSEKEWKMFVEQVESEINRTIQAKKSSQTVSSGTDQAQHWFKS